MPARLALSAACASRIEGFVYTFFGFLLRDPGALRHKLREIGAVRVESEPLATELARMRDISARFSSPPPCERGCALPVPGRRTGRCGELGAA